MKKSTTPPQSASAVVKWYWAALGPLVEYVMWDEAASALEPQAATSAARSGEEAAEGRGGREAPAASLSI